MLKFTDIIQEYFKNMHNRCAPIEFEDIKTVFANDNKIVDGPTIENLVIRSCACTEIQSCD